MPRIVVSAYACEPGRGSEAEIGWRTVRELAVENHVWVVTRANNREVHAAAFGTEGKPSRLQFVYYDLPPWLRWYKKGPRLFLVYYYLWQIATGVLSRRLHKKYHFDVAHHLTGGMDWMPSGLAFVGIPFVWGPVGSERIHPSIAKRLPLRVRVWEGLRAAGASTLRLLDPLVRMTQHRATVILSHTPEHWPKRLVAKVQPHAQTFIAEESGLAIPKTQLDRSRRFTVLYAGRLVHWKGADYAVQSFLSFAEGKPDVEMKVIGDGPLAARLRARVRGNFAESKVHFYGMLQMERLVEELHASDVLLYPSYHHGLSNIVLQAMLTGLPVVCLEGDGTGRAVGSECGVTVPVGEGRDFVSGLREALQDLYSDEERRHRLAAKAQESARTTYSYANLGAAYARVYQALSNADSE